MKNKKELIQQAEKGYEVLTPELIQELVKSKGMNKKVLNAFAEDGWLYDRRKNSFVTFDAF